MLAIRLSNSKFVKQIKQLLEDHELFDKQSKISEDQSDGLFTIYTLTTNKKVLESIIYAEDDGEQIQQVIEIVNLNKGRSRETGDDNDGDEDEGEDDHENEEEDGNRHKAISCGSLKINDPIMIAISKIIQKLSLPIDNNQLSLICSKFSRRKWSIYPPLILFPSGSNIQDLNLPDDFFQELLSKQALFFGRKGDLTHIAENAPLRENDRVRRPVDLIPIYGDFGDEDGDFSQAFWCTAIQNGIYQTWAPQYTMFSRGNITEKTRVLKTFKDQSPIIGTTVVDMYAGIGYFTFSYAKNQPSKILCWEINPWSVEGLLRGCLVNGWRARLIHEHEPYIPQEDDFIIVFLEDNAKALNRIRNAQINDISHINLGLLPDCRLAWSDSLIMGLLNSQSLISPVLHIHENIESSIIDSWPKSVCKALNNQVDSIHLELIKTFAPGIYHVCGDFRVKRAA